MKLSTKQLHKKNSGFTLTEVLIVVALVVILMAVSFVGVGQLRRNLRQRELDSKAEVIYMAAQSRIAQLRTGGFAELYSPGQDGVHKDVYPDDVDEEDEAVVAAAQNLYYVVSEENSGVAYTLLPESSVDRDLWMHNWVIEFNPTTGTVYAVFYSEASILDKAGGNPMNMLDGLREKSERLDAGAWVGYYGGDITYVDVVDKDAMKAEVRITNNEKLTAEFICYMKSGEKPGFTVEIKDAAGNSYVRRFAERDIQKISETSFSATWVLDSLDEGGGFYTQTEGRLLTGTAISVELRTSLKRSDGTRLRDNAIAYTNSLFDDNPDGDNTVAYISYGRHLQNLDTNTSQVEKNKTADTTVTKAYQTRDISFLENAGDPECYYSVYGTRKFQPIHNSKLRAYIGDKISIDGTRGGTPAISGLTIESVEANTGLFTTFSGTIENLLVTGPKIQGSTYVGVLAGSTSGATEIRNVQVYLSTLLGDLDKAGKTSAAENVTPWVTGQNVGGLVGSAGFNGSLVIDKSSASIPMKGDRYVGGLVGMANCRTTIQRSYADCYLRGANVGGLIGGAGNRAAVYLESFYAVGYGVADQKAAGILVADDKLTPLVNAYNGYCAMDLSVKEETGKIYSTAYRCAAATKTYYLRTNEDTIDCQNKSVKGIDYSVLTAKDNASFAFDAPFAFGTSGSTNPYNLLNQGLTTYTYPRFADLIHYGDWPAEFEDGALVYYEKDQRGNLRFEGGNISVDQIHADDSIENYADRTRIVGDGYALAYKAEKGGTWSAKLRLGENRATLNAQDCVRVTTGTGDEERTYYLYLLPKSMLNNDKNVSGEIFYQELTVEENGRTRAFYVNPNFAGAIGGSLADRPSVVHLRSPRHLYALSRLYTKYYGLLSADYALWQELDLDYMAYDWETYYGESFVSQEPIGTEKNPFFISYDGRNHVIENLDISSTANHVGLFGRVSGIGSVRNLVLIGEDTASGQTRTVIHVEKNSTMVDGFKTVNLGVLVGWNQGTISNCAVTGYKISLPVYNGATVNLGGLVGRNEGGTITACSAETPVISAKSYNANIYAAGFVGDNSGTVYNSYAAGYLEITESKLNKNTVRIAGFAARNDSGSLLRCYSGAALMGSGDTQMYGFTCTGGATINCYYLDGGTYEYRGKIYSLNTSQNTNKADARGTAVNAGTLAKKRMDGYSTNPATYLGNGTGKVYPYPASLTRNGSPIHFGYWPNQDKDVGTFGVFYWEYEQGGNTGYHLSFQGTTNGEPMDGGSTLCTAHDDGGVITKYGYGYFYQPTANDDTAKPHLEVTNCQLGDEDKTASAELQKQMPQYVFVAYRTGEGATNLRLDGGNTVRNATWTLTSNNAGNDSGVYTYTVSPFFANAFSLDSISGTDGKNVTRTNAAMPGTAGNSYEVRSVEQLQFINWNCGTKSTSSYISANTTWLNSSLYNNFPYLSYGKWEENWWGQNTNVPTASLNLSWEQTHDLDGKNWGKKYTPIGSMFDNAGDDKEAHATMAFFSSYYNGGDYTIKNIQIETDAQCVGLFGVTSGAKMKNIVLYSDNHSQIIHRDSGSWYAVGGLVGLAGTRFDPDSTFENCTVSGYTILDTQSSEPGWGGGCVGGMVGATTMKITDCSAVTDIEIAITFDAPWKNVRVGGLVGCARGSIENCYAGGSMKSTSNVSNSNIWMGGILGGIYLRNGGNLSDLIGATNVASTVSSSYSYVEMPSKGSNAIRSAQAIASNGEMQSSDYADAENDYIIIKNCYALDSAARNTDDYKQITEEETNTFRGINLNTTWRNETGRRIELQNDRNPYLSYHEMATEMGTYLPAFHPVTTTENAASINGKYSFPGGDKQLQGLDYPFPTILTQGEGKDQVNVHYGAWPKFGIYWQEHQATMDLLADRDSSATSVVAGEPVEESAPEVIEKVAVLAEEPEETEAAEATEAAEPTEAVPELLALDAESLQATLDWRLCVAGVDTGGISEPTFLLMDQEGNEIPENEISNAAASILEYDKVLDGDSFNVTFLGQHPGTVKVLATVTQKNVDYTTLLTLTVTADLKIAVEESALPLKAYEGDSIGDVTVTLQDANGAEFSPGANATFTWDLSIDTQDSEKDLVTWSKGGFLIKNTNGTFTLTSLKGFSAGEGALKLSLRYVWDASDGVNAEPVDTTLVLPVLVYPSDVLGLGDNTRFTEVTLPHTPPEKGRFTAQERGEGEDKPNLEDTELYLYASNLSDTDGNRISYTDLTQFDVVGAELKLGYVYQPMETVQPEEGQQPTTDDFTLTSGGATVTVKVSKSTVTDGKRNQDFTYRPIIVEGAGDGQWSLRLTLRPKSGDETQIDRTYVLEYQRPNYVSFYFQDQGGEKTFLRKTRVEQGQDLSKLDQETLDKELLEEAKKQNLDGKGQPLDLGPARGNGDLPPGNHSDQYANPVFRGLQCGLRGL